MKTRLDPIRTAGTLLEETLTFQINLMQGVTKIPDEEVANKLRDLADWYDRGQWSVQPRAGSSVRDNDPSDQPHEVLA